MENYIYTGFEEDDLEMPIHVRGYLHAELGKKEGSEYYSKHVAPSYAQKRFKRGIGKKEPSSIKAKTNRRYK